ncbi:uncharacterized protein LOC143298945 [Babylonia areolata]|uniref:uncharacterized protein LOC143298945 n=1 Tax=Babylonia areolata TaxID=304850 RepID=UPI003FD5DD36
MPLLTWEPALQPMRTSSLRTLPLPDAPPSQGIVTLGQVRCGPRAINEYVDSPRPRPLVHLKHHHLGVNSPLPPTPTTPALPGNGHTVSLPCRTNQRTPTGGVGGGGGLTNAGVGGGGGVVSTQPSKSPPPLKEEAGGEGGGKEDRHSSIICSQCGKCRCTACSEPRELPVRWCCGDRYELSARKAVDVGTCFCCVQTVFYHCGAEEDNTCYDNPCACGGTKCCSRWACLAASALFLPCLWCYWPLRGCLAASKACYNCCRKKGCQCTRQPTDKTPSNFSQTRRLLIESESSSSST